MAKKKDEEFHHTVGEIANITGAGRATVQRWIDWWGLQVDYHMPSTIPRQMILIKDLRRFFKQNDMPTYEEFLKLRKVKVTLMAVKTERVKPLELSKGRPRKK